MLKKISEKEKIYYNVIQIIHNCGIINDFLFWSLNFYVFSKFLP